MDEDMKTLSALFSALGAIDFSKDGTVARFESILAEINRQGGKEIIRELIKFLDDKFPYYEVMYLIIHIIETFSDAEYVSEILKSSPTFCTDSPHWASTVFVRILNSESTRLELIRQLRTSTTDVKLAVKYLTERINEDDPSFLAKSMGVLVASEF